MEPDSIAWSVSQELVIESMVTSMAELSNAQGRTLSDLSSGSPSAPSGQAVGTVIPTERDHQRALQGETVRRELRINDLVIETALHPMRNSAGEVERVVGLAIPSRGMEDEKNSNVSLITAILKAEQVPRFIFVSERIQTLTQHPASLWVDDEDLWIRSLHPEDKVRVLAETRRALVEGEAFEIDYRFHAKDGAVLEMSIVANPSADKSFHQAMMTIRPAHLGGALARPTHPLMQFHRLDVVSKLAGGIAHEFNNLLTSINGYARLIHDQTSVDDPLHEHAATILSCGEQAADLTDQLLKFSRKKASRKSQLNLHSLIEDLRPIIKSNLGDNIRFEEFLDARAPYLLGAKNQVEEAIINLTVNAAEAMPKGGVFILRTRTVNLSERDASEWGLVAKQNYIEITVEDRGVGIDEGMAEHVFEPFVSTKDPGKGPGLGLSIVYSIVEENDGVISFSSVPGRGTQFLILFPQNAIEAPTDKPEGGFNGNETVLLIENDRVLRQLTANYLKRHGYNCLEAGDGYEATETMTRLGNDIDMVISDVMLPYMNGLQVISILRNMNPNLRVLYISGYAKDAISEGEDTLFANNFLQKPFDEEKLMTYVRRILDASPQQV